MLSVPFPPSMSGNVFKETSNLPIEVAAGAETDADYSTPVKCPHCFKAFANFDTLKDHIPICRPERPVPFTCMQCNAAFSTREQLDKHELLHSPNAQVVSAKYCIVLGRWYRCAIGWLRTGVL